MDCARNKFGNVVKELRVRLNLTQIDLARKASVSQTQLYYIEIGKPISYRFVDLVAVTLLDIMPEELIKEFEKGIVDSKGNIFDENRSNNLSKSLKKQNIKATKELDDFLYSGELPTED